MARKGLGLVASVALSILYIGAAPAFAQVAPSLGSAQSFSVLGGSTVTNTGAGVITGDLGVSPGSAVTGFPPGLVVSGSIHAADATAAAAQSSLTTAYNNLAGQACTQDLTGQDLGGKTLIPGVYCFSTSAQLTGILLLDAQGNPGAVWVFKIGSTLTTASGASVSVINGGSVCNAFWQVGSSATLGTGTSFGGNILALASITVTTGTTLRGRALARTGAVTLDTDTVSGCAVGAVVCSAIAIAPATVPNGTKGVAYSQALTASGGTAPYSFSVSAGALPTGLTLTAGGVVAGTPSATGTFTFTVRVTDANSCPGTIVYTIVIAAPACPVIALAPPTLPNGTIAVAYNQTITGSGGTAPYVFSVTVGTLPAGLNLTSAGVLAGTPTTATTSAVTIQATDANSCIASVPYTVKIAPASCPVITLAPPALPNGIRSFAYSQTITGSGGTAPYTFGVTAGALPLGLTLTAAGVLAGTPTTAASSPVTIQGTDANSCFASVPFTVVIAACGVISLAPTPLPNATLGLAYSQAITGSGGIAPYTFGVTTGALPASLSLTPAGLLAGTVTTPGTASFNIRGTDANACFADTPLTLLVVSAVPTLPHIFVILLGLGLAGLGYVRLRRRARTA